MSNSNLKKRHFKQKIVFSLLGFTLFLTLSALVLIIYFIFKRGLGVISWDFLTQMPRNGMSDGGIFPALLGSFYLVIGSIAIAAPLGVFAAIYCSRRRV